MSTSGRTREGGGLDRWEKPLLIWLADRLPAWVTPNGLTAVGFAGSVLCLAGYALTVWTPWGLAAASLGLVVNWFGDSLDGTLARQRRIERPRFGYFLDNGLDLVEQLLVAIGVGLSGYVRWDLVFLALAVIYMMSSLSFIRACVSPLHKLAYAGWGLTEMRLVGLGLNLMIFLLPPSRLDGLGLPMTYPNLLSLTWSCATLVVFLFSFVSQLRELAREDPQRAGTFLAGSDGVT